MECYGILGEESSMNKMLYSILAGALTWALTLSCVRTVEEEAPQVIPEKDCAVLEAYILQASDDATKTDYAIDLEHNKAVFSWVDDDDHIDVLVNKGSVLSFVPFTKKEDGEVSNRFLDGQIPDAATLAQKEAGDFSLSDRAFYPSRVSPEAMVGGFEANWGYEGDKYVIDLPASITPPAAKPLAVVPMAAKRDGEGKYAFAQLTGVLGVTVSGLTGDEDFITIQSPSVALSGHFDLSYDANEVAYVAQKEATDNPGVTLHFSDLSGQQTFYFPVPVGTIPAGLRLIVGNSADPDGQMTRTANQALTITRGRILLLSKALPFQGVDQQWTEYAPATFIDDFIWGKHSAYTASTLVDVTVERSGLHPEKFRIENPYLKANAQFGYTPSVTCEADDYFIFRIEDGSLSYSQFKLGVDDKDTGGHPLMISYRSSQAANTCIVEQLPDGKPVELQFGGYYSDPSNPGYYYTRDDGNAQKIHLYIEQPDQWIKVFDEGSFIDNRLWSLHSWGDTQVPVTLYRLYQNGEPTQNFRIPNPYLIAKEQFGYETYTEGIAGDEYMTFTIQDGDAVRFTTFASGIEDKSPGGKPMKIWYPLDWGSGYTEAAGLCTVLSYREDGLPEEIKLHPIYSDVNPSNYGYKYTDVKNYLTYMYFKDPVEDWNSLGTARYRDEYLWSANSFAPYDVEVEIWRSSLDANRYRMENPYLKANTAFLRDAAGEGDEYMYLQVDPSTGQVTFGSLVTGMSKENVAVERTKNFAIADAPTWAAIKSSGATISASESRVIAGTSANPQKIQLYSVYYDSEKVSYFYTNSTMYKYIWFPNAYMAGETWTDYSEGTYVDGTYDGNINGEDAIGTVAVTIQRSSVDEHRFRINNPYRGSVGTAYLRATYDEYMYFNTSSLDSLVYMEPFRPGVALNPTVNASYELGMHHPVSSNLRGWSQGGSDFSYSSVVARTSTGEPKVVRLALHYFDIVGPTPGYCYTRQGSGRTDPERIFITFSSGSNAVVSNYQKGIKSEFHNPVASLILPEGTLERMKVKITGTAMGQVTGLRLWQNNIGGWMNSDYVAPDKEGVVIIDSFSNPTIAGDIDLNFWLTGSVVGASFHFDVLEVVVDGESLPIVQDNEVPHLGGIVVNNGGDTIAARGDSTEVCASFRIPALVTSNAGTLIAAYDVRYRSSADLVADIDVGVKRSIDGGKTWSDLIIAMDMGYYGYEAAVAAGTMTPEDAELNNGIGDPCLLVDENTGRIFCFAVWAHGHSTDYDRRSLAYAGKGFEIEDTPQFMMVYSDDDGATWSAPINITRQIKKYDWRMTFQGPGRGITMKDGTLVIPIQHQEGESKTMHGLYPLNSGIAYSTDHGETWQAHAFACPITSECTVAEIEEGVLLLSMRDETDSHYRRNYITTDLGRTWTPHVSNGQWLDSTCEASMIHVDASKNSLNKDLLLFSNPHNTSRSRMTIHASLDQGESFAGALLIDAGGSLGYSCLSMVDDSTVGILYESSQGSIYFQAVPLTDIVK